MKMVIVLAVCLALSAASASALQMPWAGLQGLYGAGSACGLQTPWAGLQAGLYGAGAGACALTTTMMGAEYLRQPQCSPVAAPYCALGGQAASAMCGSVVQQQQQQLQMQMMMMQLPLQLQGIAAASSLYGPAALPLMQQLLPAAQALTPMAMVLAQLAQNMPAMCGLPSYCATPCAAAAIPPYCC